MSKVKPVFYVIVRTWIHTNTYLVMNILVCFIFRVIILFFFFKKFFESFIFLFWWFIKVVMIEDKLTFEVNIMNNFNESDGSFIINLFDSKPILHTFFINQFNVRIRNNIIYFLSEFVVISKFRCFCFSQFRPLLFSYSKFYILIRFQIWDIGNLSSYWICFFIFLGKACFWLFNPSL